MLVTLKVRTVNNKDNGSIDSRKGIIGFNHNQNF